MTLKCSKTHIQRFMLYRLTEIGALVTCDQKITEDNKLYKLTKCTVTLHGVICSSPSDVACKQTKEKQFS